MGRLCDDRLPGCYFALERGDFHDDTYYRIPVPAGDVRFPLQTFARLTLDEFRGPGERLGVQHFVSYGRKPA